MTLADQLNSFRKNARWYAAYWLIHGETHSQEHWIISERLEKWRRQAAGCREELHDLAQSILDEFDRERAAETRPAREWLMPSRPSWIGLSEAPAGAAGGPELAAEPLDALAEPPLVSRTRRAV